MSGPIDPATRDSAMTIFVACCVAGAIVVLCWLLGKL